MPFPVPQFRPPPLPEPAPVVRVVAREDVTWNRPIFRAPVLEVHPKFFDASAFVDDFRPIAVGLR